MGNTNVLLDSKAQEIMKDVYHLGGNSGHKVTISVDGTLVVNLTYLYYVDGVLTSKELEFEGLYTLDNVYALSIDIHGGNSSLNKGKSTGMVQQIAVFILGEDTKPMEFIAPLTDIKLVYNEIFE